MKFTFEDIKKDPKIHTYISMADKSLASLGYTEHSFGHVGIVAKNAGYILETLGYPADEIELAKHIINDGIVSNIHEEKIILSNLKLVYSIAKTYKTQLKHMELTPPMLRKLLWPSETTTKERERL